MQIADKKLFSSGNSFWMLLILAVTLTLPWLGSGEFYTKGEPREAAEAMSMLNDGQWVLPTEYADEIGYKPPLMHWMIAGFSAVSGGVNEAASRLPSALALIGMTLITFLFIRKRYSLLLAMLAGMITLTNFEMHRNSMECRVDMTLAFFTAASLFGLYRWWERGLRGYPVLTALTLASACLVKGPVGVVLPVALSALFYLLKGEHFGRVVLRSVLIALPAFLILFVWYYLAYQVKGEEFLRIAFAENVGRFLGMKDEALGIKYTLGHQGPFWYYIPALLTGFLPWSLFLFFLIPAFSFRKTRTAFQKLKWSEIRNLDAFTLFSVVIFIGFVLFYSIPSSKRSVYILSMYPFASFLMARLLIWIEQQKPALIRALFRIVTGLAVLLIAIAVFSYVADVPALLKPLIPDAKTLHDVAAITSAYAQPTLITILLVALLAGVVAFFLVLKKRSIRTTLIGMFAVFAVSQLFLEGTAYPAFKNGNSLKPYAQHLKQTYGMPVNTYVINDLRVCMNIYGLNFYLGNHFRNFDLEKPAAGYLITPEKTLDTVRKMYEKTHRFEEIERSDKYNELNDEVVVCTIVKR